MNLVFYLGLVLVIVSIVTGILVDRKGLYSEKITVRMLTWLGGVTAFGIGSVLCMVRYNLHGAVMDLVGGIGLGLVATALLCAFLYVEVRGAK
jgi:hypothetical protein